MKNKENVLKINFLCATREQFLEWKSAARLSKSSMDSWFCADCLPTFKLQMMKENKCVRPEIKFRRRAEEGIEGFIPTKHNRTGELF
jgi:hypothetical protein